MLLRRFLSKNRNAEADQTSMGDDRTTSSVTTTPTHNLSGRDSEMPPEPLSPSTSTSHTLAGYDFETPPDRTESSLTDSIGVAEKFKVATANYSKRPSLSSPQFSFM